MGITLWYAPLPSSQFHSDYNDLVASLSTLIPNNSINIQYNEFEDDAEQGHVSKSPFNRYGFNILPPHITLVKNIPNSPEVFNKIIRIITTTLNQNTKQKENQIQIQDIKFNSGNRFFENCVMEVNKNSIFILLSLVTVITDLVAEIPKVAPETFNPHISLSYSNYRFSSDAERYLVKDRIKTFLRIDHVPSAENNALDWFVRMGDSARRRKSGRFYIVNCEGSVDKWTVLRYIDV